MATTFKFGNKNWAWKEGSVLAFNDENNNFKPLPFDFTRSSSATRVNKDGLIEVVGSDEPRVDYLNNADGHLLLEPSRTNLVTYSEDFTQWTKQSITDSEINLVSNSLTGSIDASELEDTSTSNYARLTLNTTTLASTAYRFSCFVKKTTGVQTSCPAFQLEIGHDYLVLNTTTGETKTDALDAGNTNYSDINVIDFNSEWWKLEMTATSVGTSTRVAIYPAFTGTFGSSASSSNIGNVTIYGIQVEQGSYATSYIPTSGSSVTRAAEASSQDVPTSVINSTQGTMYFEGSSSESNISYIYFLSLSDGTLNNRLEIRQSAAVLQFLWRVGGVYQNAISKSGIDITTNFKMAVRYSSTDIVMYYNGEKVDTITSPTLYSANTLDRIAFDEGDGGRDLTGTVKDVRLYDTPLTDSELQALTTL